MPSAAMASVAKAAFNRIFHPPQAAQRMSTTDSPISPGYSDAGSGFSAPSPSPFSSASTSTSASSYTHTAAITSSEYNTHVYDLGTSESTESGLAAYCNPTDMLSGQGVNADYSAFGSLHHPSGNPADNPSATDVVDCNGADATE